MKQLVCRFIRTETCRIKCGDDGKDLPIASTDYETIDDINVVFRECGCMMRKCVPRIYIPPKQSCWKIWYYFVDMGVSAWSQYCRTCYEDNEDRRRRLNLEYSVEVLENHLPFDENDSYFVPTDLSPRVVFREYIYNHVYNSRDLPYLEHPHLDSWCCTRCCQKLYRPVYECVSCADTEELSEADEDEEINPMELNVDDESIDEAIDLDQFDEFRRINNLTPVSIIDNLDQPDAFDRRVVDDLVRRLHDFDDEDLTDDDDILERNEEELMLQYNGYH